MWYTELKSGNKWASLWYGYVRCGSCRGIRKLDGFCPVCQSKLPSESMKIVMDGRTVELPMALAGAEGRYEDYVYLNMLEREWLKPLTNDDLFMDIFEGCRPAPRAAVILIFWTYFESRIGRIFREALGNYPEGIRLDLMNRYDSIGSRIDRLYRIVFNATYYSDLQALDYGRIVSLLSKIQKRRNEFMHGSPGAIDQQLVEELVAHLKDEHESWIAVFNLRATNKRNIVSQNDAERTT
jgi:hypothetical protein